MSKQIKARAVGFNHIALEVGDIDAALEFYRGFIDFELRGKSDAWPGASDRSQWLHAFRDGLAQRRSVAA